MIPAHIAQKVGFNNGFQTFGPAVQVSGGPYKIQSYTKGEDLVEVPNPKWWGTPAKLNKIVFRFILDDSQQPPAIQNGEVNVVNPALASLAFYDSVKNIPDSPRRSSRAWSSSTWTSTSRTRTWPRCNVRHAIAYGTNRAQMVQRIVAPIAPSIKPLNNRM